MPVSLPFRRFTVPGFVALLALLAGCVAPTGTLNTVDPGRDFARVWRDYPDMDARFSRRGNHVTLESVRSVALGQSRDQVVTAIGRPAFIHDDGGAEEFNLSLPMIPRNRLICQYMVFYDDEGAVQSTVWRRPQCASLVVTGKAAAQ